MIKHSMLPIIALSLFSFSCGKAPDMPDENLKALETTQVTLTDPKDQKNFYQLPLQARLSNHGKFWSGDYWPLNRGNINRRWNSSGRPGFNLNSPNVIAATLMSREEIMGLSPSEKFDLWLGRYDYPLKQQVANYANPKAKSWEGICNGWASATINHNEPTPKVMMNPDMIEVPFGSSDIKALISYYYAFIHKTNSTEQIGRRCPRGRWFNWNRDCRNDLNAGLFHLALSNNIGIKEKSILVDIERYKEVWNHPAIGYTSQTLGEIEVSGDESLHTKKKIRIRIRVLYADGTSENTWDPILNTDLQNFSEREYLYNLHLDEADNIIGGDWISRDRPDFIWMMGAATNFSGLMNGLEKLLND